MPRVVDLRIGPLLEERGIPWVELAKYLDVGEATVRGYIRNRWTVLDRTVLERLADFFQCDVASLLETTESRFFNPFRPPPEIDAFTPPRCIFLRRPDSESEHGGRKRSYRDDRAIEHVETLLRDNNVDGLIEIEYAHGALDQLKEHFSQNCIVVGSPMVNPAAEAAICRVFGVEAFNRSHLPKIPFSFHVSSTKVPPPSSIVEAAESAQQGIWLRKENKLISADHWPPEEFQRVRIPKGRDCAVILVMNHRSKGKSGQPRKLITLCGFSGAATEAAAQALQDHYRDLEPVENSDFVWGVIEVFYHKAARSTKRTILSYRWRCRVGGRCPIDFTRRSVTPPSRPAQAATRPSLPLKEQV